MSPYVGVRLPPRWLLSHSASDYCPVSPVDTVPYRRNLRYHIAITTCLSAEAFILDQEVIERILHHIGEETTPPRVLPARSPPQLEMDFAQTTDSVTWDEVNQTTECPDDA
jgi:hypothetical protein